MAYGDTAYSYKTQGWVRGEDARALLIEQALESLALYRGPRASEYAAFVGNTDIPATIHTICENLAILTAVK